MSELPTRTADPTLFALGTTAVEVEAGFVPVAHREVDSDVARTACGLRHEDDGYGPECRILTFMGAHHACWFAVPCREGCFDAPVPGNEPVFTPDGRYIGSRPHEGLAWQAEERT